MKIATGPAPARRANGRHSFPGRAPGISREASRRSKFDRPAGGLVTTKITERGLVENSPAEIKWFEENGNQLPRSACYIATVGLERLGVFMWWDSGTSVAMRKWFARMNWTAWRHDSNEPTSLPFSKTEMRPAGGSICCCCSESTIEYTPKAPSVLRLFSISTGRRSYVVCQLVL